MATRLCVLTGTPQVNGMKTPSLWLTAVALAALAIAFLGPFPAHGADGANPCPETASPEERRICLLQYLDSLEGRLRLVLVKAIEAAADEDAREQPNDIGFGVRVRLLDREQSLWETQTDDACGSPLGPATEGILCWVKAMSTRLDEFETR